MKRGVRIVECRDDDDPGSEGRLLRAVFKTMEVRAELVRVREIRDLVCTVADSRFSIVHVGTHGSVRNDDKAFRGWWTPNGIGNKTAFAEFEGTFRGIAIVSTAGSSGAKGFGQYVVEFLGARYYVAPEKSPYWHNAALFAHIFYFKHFAARSTVPKAFKAYDNAFKNPHRFRLFQTRA